MEEDELPFNLTSLASITVPTPTVRAMVGTLERSLPKKRALATMVSLARVFTLVLETRLEPGSLNAMWPSGPMPTERQWERTRQRERSFTSHNSLCLTDEVLFPPPCTLEASEVVPETPTLLQYLIRGSKAEAVVCCATLSPEISW